MPRWQQAFHAFAFGFVCLVFAAISILAITYLFPHKGVTPPNGSAWATLVMLGIAISIIVMQVRFRKRIIKQFR